jgi:hypothetical protein
MTIVSVDTAALHVLARRIRAAAGEARAAQAEPGPLRARFAQLGDAALICAGLAFAGRWAPALGDLVDDAQRIADAVELVAGSYEDAEAASDRLLG